MLFYTCISSKEFLIALTMSFSFFPSRNISPGFPACPHAVYAAKLLQSENANFLYKLLCAPAINLIEIWKWAKEKKLLFWQ